MATTAAGRVFTFAAVTVRFKTSRVGWDATTLRKLAAATFIWVTFSAAVTATFVDERWFTIALMAAFTWIIDMSVSAVKLMITTTWTLLAWTGRSFHWVTFSRRPRSTITAACRPNKQIKFAQLFMELLSQTYRLSLAIWDHRVLPATWQRRTQPILTPARQASTEYIDPGGIEGWVEPG